MIYSTLDEAWTQKPRVKRISRKIFQEPKVQEPKVQEPKVQEHTGIVLKDPEVVSLLKDVQDPDAFVLELMKKPSKVESFTDKKGNNDDLIFFLYFLILLVLLY